MSRCAGSFNCWRRSTSVCSTLANTGRGCGSTCAIPYTSNCPKACQCWTCESSSLLNPRGLCNHYQSECMPRPCSFVFLSDFTPLRPCTLTVSAPCSQGSGHTGFTSHTHIGAFTLHHTITFPWSHFQCIPTNPVTSSSANASECCLSPMQTLLLPSAEELPLERQRDCFPGGSN